MYLLIGTIILIAICWFFWVMADRLFMTWVGFPFYLLTALITIGSIVIFGVLIAYQFNHKTTGEIVWTHEIVALSNASEVQGSFSLGSGQVGEEQYYFYFTPVRGGHKMEKVKASQSIIFEGYDNPYIEAIQINELGGKEFLIYIPDDSILFDFSVSLP